MADESGEPHVRLEMRSQPRFLAAARALVSNIAQRLGFNEVHSGQISLAVDEALCNIINHGYQKRTDGPIWVNVWANDEGRPTIKIVIEDLARQVDPKVIRSRDLEDVRPGGLGVYIIREVMEDVRYEQREGGGMRLTMSKQLPVSSNSKPGSKPTSGEPHRPSSCPQGDHR
jgi:anti-sigma regulatory factor (Ser/Thr protein kinase)